MAHPNTKRQLLETIIVKSGGKIDDDLFVVEPGCMILNETDTTPEAKELFGILQIHNEREYEDIGEFNARLCYLSYNVDGKHSSNINDKLIEFGHLSIYNDIHVTFLIAGISDEVLKEFTAHGEAKVSRLTSSKTNAMNSTLYRVFGTSEEMATQKAYILKFLELRNQYLVESKKPVEVNNMFNLGMKATAFTFSMSLKDYHKLFIGRMPEEGNEHDVRLVCRMMCETLHQRYPKVIRPPDFYLGTSNNEKYKVK